MRQLADGRKKTGEGLAGAGRRDQQGMAAGACRGEHVELVAARRPATALEPALDDVRDQRSSVRSRRRVSSSS